MPSVEPDRTVPSLAASAAPAASAAAARPVEDLSYEQARDELVAVVARLEAGGETLEGSLQLWERGESLAARCQQWLDGARERLQAARDAPAETSARPPSPDRTPTTDRTPPSDGQDD